MKTVFILDDHDIVRFGLQTLVSSHSELQLVGSASTLAEGLAGIARLKPDLLICDMSMDDSKGLDTVRAVVEAQGDRGILIVSMHDEVLYGEQVLALGARGYLMKESAYTHAIPAALEILNGGRWVSPRLNARLLNRLMKRGGGNASSDKPAKASLTAREIDVLEELGRGKTTKEIAFELNLSSRTVDIHRANIKRKLGLKSGVELIAFALSRT